jgi:peptidoglycan/LPS O-acetylase OafA/YrhL
VSLGAPSNGGKGDIVIYRRDIDGLRCVAVVLVFVFHFFEFTSVGRAAFMGVDAFFVGLAVSL